MHTFLRDKAASRDQENTAGGHSPSGANSQAFGINDRTSSDNAIGDPKEFVFWYALMPGAFQSRARIAKNAAPRAAGRAVDRDAKPAFPVVHVADGGDYLGALRVGELSREATDQVHRGQPAVHNVGPRLADTMGQPQYQRWVAQSPRMKAGHCDPQLAKCTGVDAFFAHSYDLMPDRMRGFGAEQRELFLGSALAQPGHKMEDTDHLAGSTAWALSGWACGAG